MWREGGMSKGWFITPHTWILPQRCLGWHKACRLSFHVLGCTEIGGFLTIILLFFHLFSSFSCQFFSQLRCPFLLLSQARQRCRHTLFCACACISPSAVQLLPLTLRTSGTNRAPVEAGCNHSDSSSPEQICLALGRGEKMTFQRRSILLSLYQVDGAR